MANPTLKSFRRRLRHQRDAHRLGLAVREGLRVTGYAVTALLLYALADFLLAFSVAALTRIGGGLLAAAALLALARWAAVFRFSTRDYAWYVDREQGHRRQDIYAAFELAGATGPADYLVQQAVREADLKLRALRPREVWPWRALRRQGRVLLGQALLAGLLLGIPRGISGIVLTRILFPERDRPPYSPYTFTVTPAQAEVLYGQDLEISVDISGAPVRSAVWLLTRTGGNVQRAACFQEAPTRFAQRITDVIQPMEFAFALGRARSAWHRLTVRFDPRVVGAHLDIFPPTYSGQPPRALQPGEEPLAALAGARLRLTLTSNRPLRDGYLTLQGARDGAEREITGQLLDARRIRFEWELTQPGALNAVLRDVRGTPNQQPFTLTQTVLPDQPPRAALTAPVGFVLATPDATLPLAGYAEDDLGLRSVDLARSLAGHRDRLEPLDPPAATPRLAFARDLDLGALGVAPGQVLEFYLEAQDTNPDWSGLTISETVRIEIISREEYARLWRSRLRTEDFLARYRRAMAEWEALQRALAETLARLADPACPAAEQAGALTDLKAQYDQTQAELRRLSEDFPVFEAEVELQATLMDMVAALAGHRPALDDRAADDPRLRRRLEMVLNDLQSFEAAMVAQHETARHIAQVARLFELTQTYLQLVQAQEQLVRRMDRAPDAARPRDPAWFDSFAREEANLRAALLAFRAALLERAQALDEEYAPLQASALEFAAAITARAIPEIMETVVQAAHNRSAQEMTRQAELALERLRELLTDCAGNAFGGLMECELRFEVRAAARGTVQQMMSAWSGLGAGAGTGAGYSMSAHTPLNLPMYGPGRATDSHPAGAGGPGRERGGRTFRDQADAHHTLPTAPRAAPDARRAEPDNVPEKYRDALRRYFEWEE